MKSYMLYYPLSGYQKSRYNPGKRLAGESKEIKQKWKGQNFDIYCNCLFS